MPDPTSATLAKLDLNLLVAFDALHAERSVTRAAAALGVTQSGMSHLLKRLRQLLDDPLFVTTPRGLVPTARADELIAPIRRALGELAEVLGTPARFDAATSRREFTIYATDYVQLVLLPALLRRVRAAAPAVTLLIRHPGDDGAAELETGGADIVVGTMAQDDAALVGRTLFEDTFVCLVRADHPRIGDTLTLEAYVAEEHLLIAPKGHGHGRVDPALEAHGLKRRIALRVPSFLIAPYVISQSELILTLPRRAADAVRGLPLRQLEPPLPLAPFATRAFWHARHQDDPGHRWLRAQLAGD